MKEKHKIKITPIICMLVLMLAAVGCGPRETVIYDLGNAENSIYTPDGRLFISGTDIWEVRQTGEDHYAVSLTDEYDGEFSGMAFYNNHLFVICFSDENDDSWLMRAQLTEQPVFEKVFQLIGYSIPNGMAVDAANGHLYIADEHLFSTDGKIVRLSLTNEAVPQVIPSSEVTWMTGDAGAPSPNGMSIVDNTLYFSNFHTGAWGVMYTSIRRAAINGDTHGSVETVFQRKALNNTSYIDDLTGVQYEGETYLIAADYFKGTILVVDGQETNQTTPLYETQDDKFAGPTSCVVGQGAGFSDTDLLVTEGGVVVIDPNTCFGNRLSIVRRE